MAVELELAGVALRGRAGASGGVGDLLRRAAEAAGIRPGGGPLLGGAVSHGDRVLIKPNWVYHEGPHGTDCLLTSPALVSEVLREVLECGPSKVVIGDAPIQGCDLERILAAGYRDGILLEAHAGVGLADFRRTILSGGKLRRDAIPVESCVLLDLGRDSLLEEITGSGARFRVAMYDHRALESRHSPGRHQYMIARELLEADTVISIPKLKTHRKTGLTGGIKNLVGAVVSKEFLPHHRKGGLLDGGDCYPGRSLLKGLAEDLLDQANTRIGRRSSARWRSAAASLLRTARWLGLDPEVDGGWQGNDTLWRTVLDVAAACLYGTAGGAMLDTPARRILTVVDAITAGQGDGPLSPEPLELGAVIVSWSPAAADTAGALMLGIDPEAVPVIANARAGRWPVSRGPCGIALDGGGGAEELVRLGSNARLPAGWAGCALRRAP
jgi:uncharacterized protein (DUF362 family)